MNHEEPASSDDLRRAREDQLFEQLFGISKASLRGRGVDPDVFAREHIKEALKKRSNRELVLSPERQRRWEWFAWGKRVYVAMFIGIAFLFVAHIGQVRWIGTAGSLICLGLVGVFLALQIRKR